MPNSLKLNILIVDDVETTNALLKGLVLHVIEQHYTHIQCTIYQAYNAKKALEFLHAKNIDLAFLDIELPDRSGLELLENTKLLFPHCKAIMVSGNGTRENVVTAISGGILGFIIKPFNKARVREAFDNFMKQVQFTPSIKTVSAKAKLIDFVRKNHSS